jgi:hypothetical protein
MRVEVVSTWFGVPVVTALFMFFFVPACSLGSEPSVESEEEVVLPKAPPITCTICSEATCESGSAPTISVEIANWTDSDIYLIGSLDGSDLKIRYPLCYFEVIGPMGRPVPPRIPRFCANMNSLRVKDFVKVPPGGKFNPYDHGFFHSSQITPKTFTTPGEYRIRLVYSTDQADAKYWLGDVHGDQSLMLNTGGSNEAVVKLLAQVPKTTVTSNEITIRVVQSK